MYPLLGSSLDLGVARVAGHGLGNCFYTYFHAAVLAQRSSARLIAPPWFSVKMGPVLRGSTSRRFYWRMFGPLDGDLSGVQKVNALLFRRPRVVHQVDGTSEPILVPGALNLVASTRFTFMGLHSHRQMIRERLLGIVKDPVPTGHGWGRAPYIAVHVRLDDFFPAVDPKRILSGESNLQIPMSWYLSIIDALRRRFGDREIRIFSDGTEEQLEPLLKLGARLYRSGSDMTDLLAMSGASLLVGSNSTYSRWAAFLGDMPSIWLKTSKPGEQPTNPQTPVLYIALDDSRPTLWS